MKTLMTQIMEMEAECKTLDDWKGFANYLLAKVCELNNSSLSVQEAIIAEFGESKYEDIIMSALELENKYLPSELAMHAYGYKNDKMCPITQEKARNLFENNTPIYLLYSDGTEKKVEKQGALESHEGLFGVLYDDLKDVRKKETNTSQTIEME